MDLAWKSFPPSLRFVLISALMSVALLTIFRVVFFFMFDNAGDPAPPGDSIQAFYLGLKFDLRLLFSVHAPLVLLAMIPPLRIDTRIGRRLALGYTTIALTLIVFTYFVDFGHFAYQESRLDATMVRFLYNPGESARMVWESYPVLWLLVLLASIAFGLFFLLSRAASRVADGPAHEFGSHRWKLALPYGLIVLLFAAGIYGKLSYYPLRWSDAFFSPHRFTSMLALNPVLYFSNTFKNKDLDFDPKAARSHYEAMAHYLGVPEDERDPEQLRYGRRTSATAQPSPRPNVVLVLLESFAYYKTGFSGNPLEPTPHFDALARESVIFSRFYTAHGGTARGVFATLVGLPDIELQKTSSRNPTVVRQRILINAFEGYDKFYFLGGSASWGNIRGLLSHNLPDLQIYEEGSYSSPREDVWGISDLHLFEEANLVLRERKQPFFAVIQTAGNHRPYTIPSDNRGFELRDVSTEEAARYGFRSVAAYNSFRFLDHSIGVFLEQARQEPYYEDTLFVFLGDHGLERNAEHRPKGEHQLGLTKFHVPLLLHSPKLLPEPRVYDKIGAQVDVLPTVAGVTGTPVLNSALGRDLLDERFDDDRYAFMVRHPKIGVIGREFYLTLNTDGSNRSLHQIFSEDPRENVAERFPAVAQELEELAQGLFETARYMRKHNRPEDIEGEPLVGSIGQWVDPRKATQR